ncbi:G protein-activated inward rectifier potassium channel 3-like isoform X2 [Lycorma delicatula]|uniref:G protein-activated inward rectifier potassium channel 3-like isoform X2 n=1 Tax=Lycorma delicatula TaxID=130591 RepID=UPI003F518699
MDSSDNIRFISKYTKIIIMDSINIPEEQKANEDALILPVAVSSNHKSLLVKQESNSSYKRNRYRGPGCSYRKLRRRAVFKNGDCNVAQVNISKRRRRYLQDIFTTLVDVQWRWTLLVFMLSFMLSWLGFGCIWWLIAFTHGDLEPENLIDENWTPCVVNINSFASCFLFSIETQHTIGYGSRSTTEECPEAIIVMCLQSITGVMIQAFMVGIIFAKMARPKQRTQTLLFSRNAAICQRDGQLCLMFRVGDMREKSHLISSSVRAQIIRPHSTKEGEYLSPFLCDLKVETDDYDSDVFLIWPMIVYHKIDSTSPLYTLSAADMIHEKFEIIVILEGTTESTGQTTQARTSYLPNEVLWGHRFEPIVSYNKERCTYQVDYSLFHNTYQVDTPLCSAQELQNLTEGSMEMMVEKALLVVARCMSGAESCW